MTSILNHCAVTPKHASKVLGVLLEDCLGNYVYDDGRTRKAVSVGKPIKNAKVIGLELIVPKSPIVRNRLELWFFYLIDREDKDPDLLYNAQRLIKSQLNTLTKVTYLPSSQELGAYDQICIVLNTGQLNLLSQRFKITPETPNY
jgi:hypothetical protein